LGHSSEWHPSTPEWVCLCPVHRIPACCYAE